MKELSIAMDSLKKGKSADRKGIKAGDLKGAGEEATKNDARCLQLDHQAKLHDSQFMEKVMVTVIYKKGDPTKNRKLQTDLFLPTILQAVLHHDSQQTLRQARPMPMP